MVKGVAMVWMPVQQVDRAARFYEQTLGLEKVKQTADWAEFDANGLRIGLNGRDAAGARQDGGGVITFQPEGGLDAEMRRLQAQGVEFLLPVAEHPWGRVVTFKDSETNELQLFEPPKD